MRILKIVAGQSPQKVHIPCTLEAMQAVVDGHIEMIRINADDCVAIICNSRGYLDGHAPNRRIWDPISGELATVIHGTFFICATKGEHFSSLSRRQLRYYEKHFRTPDVFDTSYRCAPIRLVHIPSDAERFQKYVDLNLKNYKDEDMYPF